jgi:dTDP-4-dehydrorhamnose reductase
MSIRVLVLGGTGMLGHMVLKVLSADSKLSICATHIENPQDPFFFDVEQGLDKLESICNANKGCDYVINCIGITSANINLDDPASLAKAIVINTAFPHQLGLFCRSHNIRIIHISTDGVFSGRSGAVYDESSECDCADFYGRIKYLGEVLKNRNIINIRTSIVGPSPFEKTGLWDWFSSLPSGSTVTGYTNHIWNGVTTYQFAELCRKIITQNRFEGLRAESALFHFAPNQPISKYELLNVFKSALKKDITINPNEHPDGPVKRILTTEFFGLRQLYTHDQTIESALKQMMNFVDNTKYSKISTGEDTGWRRRNSQSF